MLLADLTQMSQDSNAKILLSKQIKQHQDESLNLQLENIKPTCYIQLEFNFVKVKTLPLIFFQQKV